MSQSAHLATGYVARAHGLDGEVGVKTFDPGSETLFEVERVLLKLKDGSELELTIDSVRSTGKDILVAFDEIEGRAGAERLVGSTVHVFREDLEPPSEGEYFLGDLVGLTAFDEAGNELGTVEEVWESGPVPNLVIRKAGAELMVPFADEFVPAVDVPNGRVTVKPPEFLE
jgi:16S rRNA processing protein RimM